jgi:hypothetical protein
MYRVLLVLAAALLHEVSYVLLDVFLIVRVRCITIACSIGNKYKFRE